MRTVALVCLATGTAFAEPPVTPTIDPRLDEALTGGWSLRKKWLDKGFRIKPSYQWEVFSAPELDDDRMVTFGLALLEIEYDLGKLNGKLGKLYAEGFGMHGANLSETLMDVYTVSNNAATPDVRLYEAYCEQPLGPVTIRAGLVSVDQLFTLATTGVVLLNSTFGIIGIASYNFVNPTYPVGALGATVATKTGPVKTTVALYDGDNANAHGIPTELGGEALGFAEIEISETLKLGGWHHTALGDGYYGVVQHQLENHLGVFARVSWAPDAPGIDFYADAGIRIGNRAKDFFSVGLAYADAESNIGAQTVFEATYLYFVTKWLSIQPDVQLLLDRLNGTTTILATRGTIVF